jgi:hypothetical protein
MVLLQWTVKHLIRQPFHAVYPPLTRVHVPFSGALVLSFVVGAFSGSFHAVSHQNLAQDVEKCSEIVIFCPLISLISIIRGAFMEKWLNARANETAAYTTILFGEIKCACFDDVRSISTK